MNEELTSLASMYLDGEATADERALVDGDPLLVAEVERMRQVRSVLADIEPPAISVRERHLAAALAAWDRLPAGDVTPTGLDSAAAAGSAAISAPTSLRHRRERKIRSTRWMTAAAAVVILVGVGAVARGAFIGDDTASDGSESAVAVPSAAADEQAAEAVAAAEATFDSDAPDGDAADSEQDDSATFEPAEESDSMIGGPAQAAPDVGLEVLSNRDDLARFANDLIIARKFSTTDPSDEAAAGSQADAEVGDDPTGTASDAAASTIDLCDLVDEVVGPAAWDTPGLFDELVIVGIDLARDDAVAYRQDGCVEIARAPLDS